MSYAPGPSDSISCQRCGADVALGASFCPNCGAPQELRPRSYAYDYPDEEPARRQWWVPVAIVAGALAALAGGALLSLALLDGDPPTGQTSPSASATASASASASASAGASASASPTPSPTPGEAAIIPNLGIAQVVEVVNLRSGPSQSSELRAPLDVGRRLFIIGAPTEDEDDLRWYRVATLPSSGCTTDCEVIGFVATPITEGDEWVEQVDVDCPASPMSVSALSVLQPLEALHCFGNGEIVVTGTITGPTGALAGPIAYSPAWLTHQGLSLVLANGTGFGLPLRAHPETDLPAVESGDDVRVAGHFEDPAATSCRASIDPGVPVGEGESIVLPDPATVVLRCRATFVWTDVEVTSP